MEVRNSYMEMLEQPAEQLRMKLAPFTGTVPSTSGTYGFYNETNGAWVLFGNDRLNGSEPAVTVSVHQRVQNKTPVGCGAQAHTRGRETFTDYDKAFHHVLGLLAKYHPELWKTATQRMFQFAGIVNDIHLGLECAETGGIKNTPYEDGARTLKHLKKLVEPHGHLRMRNGYYPTIPVPMRVEAPEPA